jgi:NAD(P)H-quinone oxidoreductase subunit L
VRFNDRSALPPGLYPDVIMLIALVYIALAGAFLLIVPLGLYLYLQKRWYVAGSIERLVMYGLVFLFFPGMLLLTPLLNFRPERRAVDA